MHKKRVNGWAKYSKLLIHKPDQRTPTCSTVALAKFNSNLFILIQISDSDSKPHSHRSPLYQTEWRWTGVIYLLVTSNSKPLHNLPSSFI